MPNPTPTPKPEPWTVTAAEAKLLVRLTGATPGHPFLVKGEPTAGMKSLVRRGYCDLSPALAGPLAVPTGETIIALTPLARWVIEQSLLTQLIEVYQPADPAPGGPPACPFTPTGGRPCRHSP